MSREQACNDDVDAAVDAFFNGTLDARVDAARGGGEDVGGAVPGDDDGANGRGRRGATRRDGGAERGGRGGDGDESDDAMMMDSDDEIGARANRIRPSIYSVRRTRTRTR